MVSIESDRTTESGIARLSEREALKRLELLASVSRSLADALEDYRDALDDVAEACVPDFCDLLAVEVLDEGGEVSAAAYRVAPSCGLRVPGQWTPIAASCTPDRNAVLGFARPGEPAPLKAVREAINAESLIIAPITARGSTLGWLVLANGRHRRGFRSSALGVGTELSMRLGTAIQRVLLYRTTVASTREQSRTVRRLRRLAAAATNLAGAATPEAVLRVGCVDACVMHDANGAAARWWLSNGREITAMVGDVDPAVMDHALTSVAHGRAARGPGWAAAPLPCTDSSQHGALAIFASRELSVDEEFLLKSLASLIPVAFDRAIGTETAVLHEARLSAVLEASPIALITVRPNGTVASANEAGKRLFCWTGADSGFVLPGGIRPAMSELAVDVRRSGSVSDRAIGGEGFDLSVSGAPMPAIAEMDEQSVVFAISDLTERRHAERSLLQAQRLEAMGQIAGRVAHDFNNLLTVIVGYVDLLQRSVDAPRQHEMLTKIDQAASRAAALTQQMLGFTRRQLDTQVVIDWAVAVRSLESVLARLAGAGTTVSVETPPTEVKVRCDPSEMEQIILNLAINACDAMEGAGALSIQLEVLSGQDNAGMGLVPGWYGRLSVSDTGPGMSSDVLARCLEPFFTTKDRGQGSGLGLSTAYGLTVERGGLLSIDSAPGRGTAVHVLLPLVSDQAVSVQAEQIQAWPAGQRVSGRVLLVEDEPVLRELAERSLCEIGLEVVSAASAEPVLAQVEAWSGFDALITDLVLPGIGGAELAGRLRSAVPDLPVLYMTGYAERSSPHHHMVPGSRLLRKPFRADELCLVVAAMLEEAQGSKR